MGWCRYFILGKKSPDRNCDENPDPDYFPLKRLNVSLNEGNLSWGEKGAASAACIYINEKEPDQTFYSLRAPKTADPFYLPCSKTWIGRF